MYKDLNSKKLGIIDHASRRIIRKEKNAKAKCSKPRHHDYRRN